MKTSELLKVQLEITEASTKPLPTTHERYELYEDISRSKGQLQRSAGEHVPFVRAIGLAKKSSSVPMARSLQDVLDGAPIPPPPVLTQQWIDDERWLFANLARLVEEHPESFIAVCNRQVAGVGRTGSEALDQAEKRYPTLMPVVWCLDATRRAKAGHPLY